MQGAIYVGQVEVHENGEATKPLDCTTDVAFLVEQHGVDGAPTFATLILDEQISVLLQYLIYSHGRAEYTVQDQ